MKCELTINFIDKQFFYWYTVDGLVYATGDVVLISLG
jgi:hypothetical protein